MVPVPVGGKGRRTVGGLIGSFVGTSGSVSGGDVGMDELVASLLDRRNDAIVSRGADLRKGTDIGFGGGWHCYFGIVG